MDVSNWRKAAHECQCEVRFLSTWKNNENENG